MSKILKKFIIDQYSIRCEDISEDIEVADEFVAAVYDYHEKELRIYDPEISGGKCAYLYMQQNTNLFIILNNDGRANISIINSQDLEFKPNINQNANYYAIAKIAPDGEINIKSYSADKLSLESHYIEFGEITSDDIPNSIEE